MSVVHAAAPPAAWHERAVRIAGAALALAAIAWSLDLPYRAGLLVYTEQFIAAMLGVALAISYARTRDGQPPAARRLVLAALALAGGAWLALRYPALQADVLGHRAESLALSLLLLGLVIDACRRSVGVALAVVFAFFLVYAFVGHRFGGLLQTK